MKKIVLFAASFIAISAAQASTPVTPRHQGKIAAEIQLTCGGTAEKTLRILSHDVELDRVDQGVIDQYHSLEIEVTEATRKYTVNVESVVYSAYDHADQDWGVISVESVLGCP